MADTETTTREWWTPKELAEHWRLSVSTIHRMHTGDPENFGRVMSGSLRIHNSHVERFCNPHVKPATRLPAIENDDLPPLKYSTKVNRSTNRSRLTTGVPFRDGGAA